MGALAKDSPTFTALRKHFSSATSTMFTKARVLCKDVPISAVLIRSPGNVNSLMCNESAAVPQKLPTLAMLIKVSL